MSWRVLEGKKVAVLTETEYIHDEMEYYRLCFPLLGAEVHFMAHLWGQKTKRLIADIADPVDAVYNIRTMDVDREVADANPNDYDIVIQAANYTSVRLREIPPMGSFGSVEQTRDAPAVKFFAEAMRNKRIVKGAMCHALWILTPCPELLKGRRVICHTVVLSDIHNAGAIYAPNESEVVVDDDLVTARSFANVKLYFDTLVQEAVKRSQISTCG